MPHAKLPSKTKEELRKELAGLLKSRLNSDWQIIEYLLDHFSSFDIVYMIQEMKDERKTKTG